MNNAEKIKIHLRYSPVTALKEHLFQGNSITYLEAQLLFGVRNLTSELTRLKQQGHIIQSRKVPMARVIRRLNKDATCKPPSNLPILKIVFTEWWISE